MQIPLFQIWGPKACPHSFRIGTMIAVILSQSFAPFDYATATWYMRNGALSHSGLQNLKGAVSGPNLRCSYSGITGEGDPLIADINGDGLNEIVFSAYSPAQVIAIRGTDCTLLWSYDISATSWGTAAVGELDPSVPGLEVVATSWNSYIYALRGTDGTLLWSRRIDTVSFSMQSSVAVYDVNGDGIGEVFVHTNSEVLALRGTDGTTIWSYPASGRYNSPAVYDVDMDSQYEVIDVTSGGTLLVLDANTGTLDYSVSLGGSTEGSPTVSDIDGDGTPDIVVGTSGGRVVAVDGPSGTVLWNVAVGGNNRGTPSVYDVNGDGVKEVLIGNTSGNAVYALRGTDGTVVWSYSHTYSYEQAFARKLGDVDNDGEIEVVLTSYGSRVGSSPMFIVLNGSTGTPEWTYDVSGKGTEGASIGDVDNDGCMEIVVAPDWTSSGGIRVFDSSTPVSGCGVLGYDDPLSARENRAVRSVFIKVRRNGNVLTVETGRDVEVVLYSLDGRLVHRYRTTEGRVKINLPKGVYILRIPGYNLMRTVIM